MFTVGLAQVPFSVTCSSLLGSPKVPGLVHAECLTRMDLGSPIISAGRAQFRHVVMFAAWESEQAIDDFLATTPLGQGIASGWHVRMEFLRRWGSVKELAWLPESAGEADPEEPVVAFTLARMRLLQVPRFLRWGLPTETYVRDHPGARSALAAIRYPRTIATFSIWNSQQAMLDMVRSGAHVAAMRERERRDFHHEFTTLRFRPLAEYGACEGQTAS